MSAPNAPATTAPRHRRLLVTIIIVGVLFCQLAVSVLSIGHKWQGRQHTHRTWPFLDYPMYGYSSGPPVETTVVNLTAVLENGEQLDISQEFMGYSFFTWRYRIVARLVAHPVSAEKNPELAGLVEQHRAEALEKVLGQIAAVTSARVVELRVGGDHYRADAGNLIKTQIQQVIDLSELAGTPIEVVIDPGLIDVQPEQTVGPGVEVEAMREMENFNGGDDAK